MKDGEYLFILLDGFVNHREYLANYYWRKAKKAEEEHISFDEFYSRMISGLNTFEDAIRDEISREQHKLFMFIDQCYQRTNEQNKQEMEENIKTANELMNDPSGQYHKNNISLHLPTYTQNKFFGQLYLNDVNEMRLALLEIGKRFVHEEKSRQTQETQEAPSPKPPAEVPSLRFDKVKAIFDEYKFFDKIPELRHLNEENQTKVIKWISEKEHGEKPTIAGFVQEYRLHIPVMEKHGFSSKKQAFRKLHKAGIGCSVTLMNENQSIEKKSAKEFINSLH